LNNQAFLDREKDKLLNHPLFEDDFIAMISSLKLFEPAKARKFALLYYPHILRTRLYQASTLGITPDENIQFVLSEIVYDEYGLGDIQRSHMQQYRKFLYALGLDDEEIKQPIIIPELENYIDVMTQLTQSKDWLAAVAAVGVASEHIIPKYYKLLLQGLRNIPSIKDNDLELFIGHIDLDIEHSRMVEQAILPYLDSDKNQAEFCRGLEINMQARREFHAGLFREVF
jgi:pyrroloquinoline-quinone synthase